MLDVAAPFGFGVSGCCIEALFSRQAEMAILVDGSVLRVEIIPNVWCRANFVEAHMI